MVSLYLIAKNGKDGLRDAWRLTAEGLAGSMDILIPIVTSDVFAEGSCFIHCPCVMSANLYCGDRSSHQLFALPLQAATPRGSFSCDCS